MFLRKLLGSNPEKKKDGEVGPPAGVQAMGATLQRKFAKGVQYNSELNLISVYVLSRCFLSRKKQDYVDKKKKIVFKLTKQAQTLVILFKVQVETQIKCI